MGKSKPESEMFIKMIKNLFSKMLVILQSKKKLIIIISIVAVLGISVWGVKKLSITQFIKTKIAIHKVKTSNEEFNDIVNRENFSDNLSANDYDFVINVMPKMSNTKIVAEYIWGNETITEEKVNGFIIKTKSLNSPDKQLLLDILYRWKDGNFINAVNEHNYLWIVLNGTVGEAYALRDDYNVVHKSTSSSNYDYLYIYLLFVCVIAAYIFFFGREK
jgi:hypothetical protein